MNKLMITGNLTKDPEKRVTPQGITVCSFTVAVNRRRGQDQETDYFRVTTWRELAESCGKFLNKGRKVCVVGSVSVSTYQTQTGETRANMDVTAQEVEFLSPANKDQQTENKPNAVKGYVEVTDDELPWG
jgi:single-strand DNA-binding protein